MTKQEYLHYGKQILIIGFFFLVVALIISAVERKKGAEVEAIEIKIEQLEPGHSLINKEDVLRNIEKSFGFALVGLPIGSINVERVERVIGMDPFVKEVDVYVDAVNVIHVLIDQHEPILRVIDKNGLSYYLDKEGGNVPLSRHYTPRVIVATGEIIPFDRDYLIKKEHVLKDLYELTIRILNDEFLAPMVEQIYVTKSGAYHLIPKLGDQTIILGDMDRLEEKILYLKNFYKEALPFKGWQRYKTINLTFKGQVVADKK